MEYNLCLIKPDGVEKNILPIAEKRIKSLGHEIVAVKKIIATQQQVTAHFAYNPSYIDYLGEKVLSLCAHHNLDQSSTFIAGLDQEGVGNKFYELLQCQLVGQTVIPILVRGNDAIKTVKELCGATFPADASACSIRGMYATDSFTICMQEGRGTPNNLIHAAGDRVEAIHQINVWFPEYNIG